jgi:hypothetical protein
MALPTIDPRCSFCGRNETRAGPLVAGGAGKRRQPPDVFICRDCVRLCQEILDQR